MNITPEMVQAYRDGLPFPHIVLEDVYPADRLEAVAREIEAARIDPEAPGYGFLGKRRASNVEAFPPETRRLIEEMNGPDFIAQLEVLTGIDGLEADPGLEGGGIHQIPPGGYLKVHTDFNWHRALQRHRRVNVLLYLNQDWREDWGGALELWSEEQISRPDGAAGQSILPVFNRMVVFSTTDYSYHGHPHQLNCPPGRTRNSLALYYYSKDRPAGETRFGNLELTNYRGLGSDTLGLKHRLHQAMINNPGARRIVDAVRGVRGPKDN